MKSVMAHACGMMSTGAFCTHLLGRSQGWSLHLIGCTQALRPMGPVRFHWAVLHTGPGGRLAEKSPGPASP